MPLPMPRLSLAMLMSAGISTKTPSIRSYVASRRLLIRSSVLSLGRHCDIPDDILALRHCSRRQTLCNIRWTLHEPSRKLPSVRAYLTSEIIPRRAIPSLMSSGLIINILTNRYRPVLLTLWSSRRPQVLLQLWPGRSQGTSLAADHRGQLQGNPEAGSASRAIHSL